jgi:uncharacterized protein YfaS (alpha-2-macroglobulin family)
MTGEEIVYRSGNTVRFSTNGITDFDGVLETADPDSQSIKIYDPTGALKETITNPTKKATGYWYCYYTLPDAAMTGTWQCKWTVTYGTKPSNESYFFPAKA